MGQSEAVIRRTDNKISKIDKQIKQSFQKNRKLLIEHLSNTNCIYNWEMNSGVPGKKAVPLSLVAHVSQFFIELFYV